jgi:DNA-binding MarR family transcriptional regulator
VKSLHNESSPLSALERSGGTGGALERLFELAVMTSEFMERGLAGRGLSRARASVLWALHQRGPSTQRELADLIGVTPRNITGLLDGLEADGFAERGRHPTDRRAALVSLTAKGTETMTALTEEYQNGYNWLFEGIRAEDLAAFVSVACTVMDRLRTIEC